MRHTLHLVGLCLLVFGWISARAEEATITGFFACERCTAPRAATGIFTPSGPVCAKDCIEHGSEAVLVDAPGKQLLKVRNYATVTDDLGYRVEVHGEVDRAAHTITVASVKRLEYVGASCERRKK